MNKKSNRNKNGRKKKINHRIQLETGEILSNSSINKIQTNNHTINNHMMTIEEEDIAIEEATEVEESTVAIINREVATEEATNTNKKDK